MPAASDRLYLFSFRSPGRHYHAFTQYNYRDGIFGSKWVGLKNFTVLFKSPAFGRLIRNTVSYSTSFIIIGHVIAIFTALMLYELSGKKLKSCTRPA